MHVLCGKIVDEKIFERSVGFNHVEFHGALAARAALLVEIGVGGVGC